MRNLHEVPRFDDRWAYLYLEMGQLDKDAEGLMFSNVKERLRVPIDQLSVIMLGPGTTVTQAAAKAAADNACLLCWTGQDGIRLYAHSTGATHSARRLIRQAELVSDPESRDRVARRMYRFRFAEDVPEDISIESLRGKEGYRVRNNYQVLAQKFGVEWHGRNYEPGNWDYADPLNRALSTANACLHGICHAAIVSAGYSAGLGFIHTGQMLSFVYDIADLYKSELTVPTAFATVAENPPGQLERAVREACRHQFYEFKLMERLLPDIKEVLGVSDDLGEGDDELAGRIISLASRSEDGSVRGESQSASARYPMGERTEEIG